MKDPVYFPIDKGLYEVALSLRPLGANLGNPDFDNKIFHQYSNYIEYYQNKLTCLNERKSKYICRYQLSNELQEKFITLLTNQLCNDQADSLFIENNLLKSKLIDHTVNLSNDNRAEVLDGLCLFAQEDIALVTRNNQTDYIAYLNLCSPSHWAAEDKIGKNFFDVHVPIPGIEKINSNADKIIEMMINKGPFVRFIWSFVTDTRLNHHPIAPDGMDQNIWKGRSFNNQAEIPFYLRIERQCILGMPDENASLFSIGVNFISGKDIKNNELQKNQLIRALHSMNQSARVYKGVDQCFNDLINYLA